MRKVASNIVRRFQTNMLHKLSNDFGIGMAGLSQFSGGAEQARYQQHQLQQPQKPRPIDKVVPAIKSGARAVWNGANKAAEWGNKASNAVYDFMDNYGPHIKLGFGKLPNVLPPIPEELGGPKRD